MTAVNYPGPSHWIIHWKMIQIPMVGQSCTDTLHKPNYCDHFGPTFTALLLFGAVCYPNPVCYFIQYI